MALSQMLSNLQAMHEAPGNLLDAQRAFQAESALLFILSAQCCLVGTLAPGWVPVGPPGNFSGSNKHKQLMSDGGFLPDFFQE